MALHKKATWTSLLPPQKIRILMFIQEKAILDQYFTRDWQSLSSVFVRLRKHIKTQKTFDLSLESSTGPEDHTVKCFLQPHHRPLVVETTKLCKTHFKNLWTSFIDSANGILTVFVVFWLAVLLLESHSGVKLFTHFKTHIQCGKSAGLFLDFS